MDEKCDKCGEYLDYSWEGFCPFCEVNDNPEKYGGRESLKEIDEVVDAIIGIERSILSSPDKEDAKENDDSDEPGCLVCFLGFIFFAGLLYLFISLAD